MATSRLYLLYLLRKRHRCALAGRRGTTLPRACMQSICFCGPKSVRQEQRRRRHTAI
jgi:hypothetical protein